MRLSFGLVRWSSSWRRPTPPPSCLTPAPAETLREQNFRYNFSSLNWLFIHFWIHFEHFVGTFLVVLLNLKQFFNFISISFILFLSFWEYLFRSKNFDRDSHLKKALKGQKNFVQLWPRLKRSKGQKDAKRAKTSNNPPNHPSYNT